MTRLPLALLLLLPLAPLAHAEDEVETPGARWKRVADAFPEPSAAKGYAWDVDFTFRGRTIGSGRLAATPGEEMGKAVWTTENTYEIQGKGMGTQTEVLSRTLDSLHGESREEADVKKHVTWRKTDDGRLAVSVKRGEDPVIEGSVDGEGRLLVGIAAGMLALRLAPAEAAAYETFDIDDDATSSTALRRTTSVAVKGTQTWTFAGKDREAWIAEVTHAGQTMRVALDPTTRDLLAMEAVGQPLAVVPKGQGKPAAAGDLSKPATSPRAAAAKAAIAFACGDKDLLEGAVHWPTAIKALRASKPDDAELASATDEQVKAGVMSHLQEHAPRAMVEPMVLGMADGLEAKKLENGNTLVKFPEMFKSLELEVGEIDGAWYLVRFPEAPE
jgi:hypothetical protein